MLAMFTFNKKNVIELLCEEYEGLKTTVPSAEEIRMKDIIKGMYVLCISFHCSLSIPALMFVYKKLKSKRKQNQIKCLFSISPIYSLLNCIID